LSSLPLPWSPMTYPPVAWSTSLLTPCSPFARTSRTANDIPVALSVGCGCGCSRSFLMMCRAVHETFEDRLPLARSDLRSDLHRRASEAQLCRHHRHDHGGCLPNSRRPGNWNGRTWCIEPAVEAEVGRGAVDGSVVPSSYVPRHGQNFGWHVGAQEAPADHRC
jgi:hypothetical protein